MWTEDHLSSAARPLFNPTRLREHSKGVGVWMSRALVSLVILISGCFAPRSYVALQYRSAGYPDIKPHTPTVPVILEAHFQVNGEAKPAVNRIVRAAAIKVLMRSRVFVVQETQPSPDLGNLTVVVDNIADLGKAKAQGFATGLTFGAAGTDAVDRYEMTVTYMAPNGKKFTQTYKHELHTLLGAGSQPPNTAPVPRELAFQQVAEDMMLNFLRDLENRGQP
jgi:hypothetical protein